VSVTVLDDDALAGVAPTTKGGGGGVPPFICCGLPLSLAFHFLLCALFSFAVEVVCVRLLCVRVYLLLLPMMCGLKGAHAWTRGLSARRHVSSCKSAGAASAAFQLFVLESPLLSHTKLASAFT
jgi:hypothetical protein